MLDVTISSLGFTLDQTILFMGNDNINKQLTDLEDMHNLKTGELVNMYQKEILQRTYLSKKVNGLTGDFQVTMQIYDFAPGGFALEGISGEQ